MHQNQFRLGLDVQTLKKYRKKVEIGGGPGGGSRSHGTTDTIVNPALPARSRERCKVPGGAPAAEAYS